MGDYGVRLQMGADVRLEPHALISGFAASPNAGTQIGVYFDRAFFDGTTRRDGTRHSGVDIGAGVAFSFTQSRAMGGQRSQVDAFYVSSESELYTEAQFLALPLTITPRVLLGNTGWGIGLRASLGPAMMHYIQEGHSREFAWHPDVESRTTTTRERVEQLSFGLQAGAEAVVQMGHNLSLSLGGDLYWGRSVAGSRDSERASCSVTSAGEHCAVDAGHSAPPDQLLSFDAHARLSFEF